MTKKVQSLYIHFPFCRHRCNYCDFYKVLYEDGSGVDKFQEYLEDTLVILHQKHNQWGLDFAPLQSLYIGGGTPSLWGAAGANHLAEFLDNHGIELNKDCEFTIEVNPGGWTENDLQTWYDIGCNRISFGMQTLNEKLFPYLDRVHTLEQSKESLKYIAKTGVNYSIDLMLGLPESEKFGRNVLDELKFALDHNPSHFSLYILTVGENYKHRDLLPSEEYVEEEFLKVADFLKSQGFRHYEVSNFSLTGKESKHNSLYWDASSVAALGPSATGFSLTNQGAVRYKWLPNSTDLSIEELGESELKMEKFYLGLRTSKGLNPQDFFSGDDLKEFKELAQKWDGYQLVDKASDDRIILNSRGYLVMDSLMDEVFSRIKSL